MKIRADKLLMAGVVGAGLYAAYRMTQAKPALPAPDNSTEEDGLILLGDPLTMQTGRYYRGRLDLPAPANQPILPFNSKGTEEDLGRALVALGFADVRVYMSASELPDGWPASTAASAGAGTRWFQGQWGQPDVKLPRPGQLRMIWIADGNV